MGVISSFEAIGSESYIEFCVAWGGDLCLVDDILSGAVIRKGAGFFIAAIAFIFCLVAIGIYLFGIVGFYDVVHIIHSAVSYFEWYCDW